MKVLVNVYVPAIGERLDVLIPDWLSVREIILLLVKNIEFLSNNRYITTGSEQLCQKETNIVFCPSEYLSAYFPKNGEQLILI